MYEGDGDVAGRVIFPVGTRVRVKNDPLAPWKGESGTVIEEPGVSGMTRVAFDNEAVKASAPTWAYMSIDWLEPITTVQECPTVSDDRIAELEDENAELKAQASRYEGWPGLLNHLDDHWPESIFPTLPDTDSRDQGPRIVSLIRWVARLEAENAELKELLRSVKGPGRGNAFGFITCNSCGGNSSIHDQPRHYTGCLWVRIQEALGKEPPK